jgi:hypothetical protein
MKQEQIVWMEKEQIAAMIDIINSDIQYSSFDIPDYDDVELMTAYKIRAELLAMFKQELSK